MKSIRLPVVLLCVATFATPLAGQTPQPVPPGMPPNPYERPLEMEANEKAADSANEQMRRGLRDARVEAAATKARSGGRSRQAKSEELVVGARVADKQGVLIGAIDAVGADGIVVRTSTGKVMVPAEAFGKNKNGLLVDVTKDEFDALVLSANNPPVG